MGKYSKAEQQVMRAEFRKLFNVPEEYVNTSAITNWMETAPIGIVEYDGTLQNESPYKRDRRMETIEVYDGNIKPLVQLLRELYPEHKFVSKWGLVFSVYNGIVAAKDSIEQAESQVVFGNSEDTSEVPQVTEELQTNLSASTEEAVSDNFMNPPTEKTLEQGVPAERVTVSENTKAGSSVDGGNEVVEDSSVSEQEDATASSSNASDSTPSGNANTNVEQSYSNTTNKNISNKEEKVMSSEIETMLDAAKKSAGKQTSNPGDVQKAPQKSNVSQKGADNEAKAKVAELLAGQKEARNAWTRANTVTAIISTMKPAALRTQATVGKAVPNEDDPAKATEKITEKINKFIASVTGKEGLTMEAFEALPDEQKYANVVVKEGANNTGKAAAMYALYKQILQNPLGTYGAYIPTKDKVSYPTRGYMIGSTPYPEQEFILQLIDNGMGVIYGEGSMDSNGNDVGEKPVTFKVGIATRTEKAKSTGVSTAKKESRVPVVRPKNKKEFINGGEHVTFLFTQEDEAAGSASFKAAINVGGELVPATVSVYTLENGKKVVRSAKEDAEPTYKTKVVSIPVSVPVTKIKKDFGAEYHKEGEDIIVTASRWGVQMKIEGQKENFGNISEFSAAPALDVFANVFAGAVKLNDTLRGSESLKLVMNAANEQAAADAAASSDELA